MCCIASVKPDNVLMSALASRSSSTRDRPSRCAVARRRAAGMDLRHLNLIGCRATARGCVNARGSRPRFEAYSGATCRSTSVTTTPPAPGPTVWKDAPLANMNYDAHHDELVCARRPFARSSQPGNTGWLGVA